jgi:predicted ATP-dependent endonuclease of OLD family
MRQISHNAVQFRPVVKQLQLRNFKRFTNLVVPFEEDLTVFIGNNGAGKTSILDAIYASVYPLFEQSFNLKLPEPLIVSGKMIKNGTSGAIIGTSLDISFMINEEEDEILIVKDDDGDIQNNESQNIWVRYDGSILFEMSINEGGSAFDTVDKEELMQTLSSHKSYLRRSIDNQPFIKYFRPASLSDKGYYGDFSKLKKWVDIHQKMVGQQGSDSKAAQNLQLLNKVVSGMMSDEGVSYHSMEIRYSLEGDETLTITKKELGNDPERMAMEQLSAGERTLLGMVTDIAIELLSANKQLSEDATATAFSEGYGLVLIDEIDAHLHPKWQRRLLTELAGWFSRVQFIVTTHSPVTVGMLESSKILIIEDGELFHSEETHGRDVSLILESVMAVQSSKFEIDFEQIAKEIALNRIDEAQTLLLSLITKIKDNPEDHPSVLRLQSAINRKKAIPK